MIYWLLHVFSPWFSLFVNLVGAIVLLARIFLKFTKPASVPDGKYAKFRVYVSHIALRLGALESQI